MSALDRNIPPPASAIRPFVFPSVNRSTLDNGLTVFAARHGRLPVVTALVVVDAGAAREDVLQAGLAYLTANALDTGTATRNGEELAWEFEQIGVELTADATWDAILVHVTAPTARLEPALALLADVVRSPSFPEAEIDRLRGEQLAEILQRQKEPRALANDMASHFIFGKDALYGRPLVGTAARVGALTRAHVAAFHSEHFVPANASLVLVGDIDRRASTLAQRYFGDWRQSRETARQPSPLYAKGERGTTVFLVDRPDAVQSEIRVGHIGVSRDHRDYFPLIVMNTVLGGAFTSRLNLNLRERQGFTYGVRSGFAFRRAPGPFVIHTAVATEVTARAVEEILAELKLIRNEGATDEEVDNARRYLAGILPLELQTTEQLAGRLADIVIFGLPDDYFASYPAHIAAVSREDVARVAREQLKTDNLSIVIIGNAAAVVDELKTQGNGPVELHTPQG
ncbi:MAG: M16 family metallopeptidase [Longimicrobiales bacterium]